MATRATTPHSESSSTRHSSSSTLHTTPSLSKLQCTILGTTFPEETASRGASRSEFALPAPCLLPPRLVCENALAPRVEPPRELVVPLNPEAPLSDPPRLDGEEDMCTSSMRSSAANGSAGGSTAK